ncbi:MAG: hypothetical protein IT364_04175 [Candidatus Hydrogenedentes bacterium]|nr:hypothetical protein [Candidatus Hydrogenedentota bacterium]
MRHLVWSALAVSGVLCAFSVLACAIQPPYAQRFAPEIMALQDTHPKLFRMLEEASNELDAMADQDYTVPDAARRQAMADWHKKARPPEEASYIVSTLFGAYAQDPPDWRVVHATLCVSLKGMPDLRVTTLAEGLVRSASELPDEAMSAVSTALGILALSGREEDIELVKKATSRAFVGLDAESETGFIGGPREFLCQGALYVLFMYAPLEQAIDALEDVAKSYKRARPGFESFMKGMAEGCLDQLKRVQKGEKVPLPRPS